jgi:hypothetical protein
MGGLLSGITSMLGGAGGGIGKMLGGGGIGKMLGGGGLSGLLGGALGGAGIGDGGGLMPPMMSQGTMPQQQQMPDMNNILGAFATSKLFPGMMPQQQQQQQMPYQQMPTFGKGVGRINY